MTKFDVYVCLDGEWIYVTSCSTDMGEIATALQVLFPQMKGLSIEPYTEPETDNVAM